MLEASNKFHVLCACFVLTLYFKISLLAKEYDVSEIKGYSV